MEKLKNEVFQALGEASMQWIPRPSSIFDSGGVEEVGNKLMEKIESDVPNAIKVLIKALKEDPEYYYAWQANIAMAFKDQFYRHVENINMDEEHYPSMEILHEIANDAAKNFLNLLTYEASTTIQDGEQGDTQEVLSGQS